MSFETGYLGSSDDIYARNRALLGVLRTCVANCAFWRAVSVAGFGTIGALAILYIDSRLIDERVSIAASTNAIPLKLSLEDR